jgi:hypothetical protein
MNFNLVEFLDQNHFPNLHFPVVLPTYAFFSDNYKEHLEKEYEEIGNCFTSDAFKSVFVPIEKKIAPSNDISPTSTQSKANIDSEGIEKHSKFLLDILSAQVDSEEELKGYMDGMFDFVENISSESWI